MRYKRFKPIPVKKYGSCNGCIFLSMSDDPPFMANISHKWNGCKRKDTDKYPCIFGGKHIFIYSIVPISINKNIKIL